MTHKLANKTILGASLWKFLLLTAALFFSNAMPVYAQDEAEPPAAEAAAEEPPAEEEAGPVDDYLALLEAQGDGAPAYDFFTTSMLWTVIAAALVFLMHLGFATLESGLCQNKNVVNVLFKNVFIISIGIVSYAVIGFNTHYPGFEEGEAWLKFGGMIGDLNAEGGAVWGEYANLSLAMTGFGDFIFQAMFAATGATIVSGAVAERVKLPSFMIFAALFVGLAYPIAGSWHWGGGYLNQLDIPFKDFAGSTVVHAFGGFGALACVMVLGPRKGKYTENGIKPIPAHSFPLAAIGVFLLMFGWYGFNGGSVLSAEPAALGLVFTTTTLAACAGALGAIVISWAVLKKPDLSMILNGSLAGLVGITAGADVIAPALSIIIEPFCTVNNPSNIYTTVVFPAPDPPTKPIVAPILTLITIDCIACEPPSEEQISAILALMTSTAFD